MAAFVKALKLDPPVEHRPFAGQHIAMQPVEVCLPAGRRNNRFGERASERFLSRPAESKFGLRVPVLDYVRSIDRNERVVRRIDDRTRPRLVLAERMLDLLALGDVLRCAEKRGGLPGVVAG